MRASQLRDLTRKYAAGGLPREEYLVERARLIDGIVAGEIEIRYRDLEPAANVSRRSSTQKHWLYAGGSVMLVGLLLIALLVHFLDDGTQPAERNVAVPVIPADPGPLLLEQFLDADDWSDASVEQLEAGWNGLTPFQQESARRSAPYRRMRYETAQRITEQEALLAAGEMEALLRASRLREFAERMGLQAEQ